MRLSSIQDPVDSDGYHYLVQCVDKKEIWWKSCEGGYQIKISPAGQVKWIGDQDTLWMYLNNELDWSEIG